MEWSENHIKEKIGHLERYSHLPSLAEGKIVEGINLEILDGGVQTRLEEIGGLKERK